MSCSELLPDGHRRCTGRAARSLCPYGDSKSRRIPAAEAELCWDMTRFLSSVALALVACFACLWFVPGGRLWLSETVARIADSSSNQRAYETVVRRAADWVRAFRQQHSRLPMVSELDGYAKTNCPGFSVGIYDSPPTWQRSWGQLGVDFMVCVHAGEWNLYRQSWDGKEWKAWTD